MSTTLLTPVSLYSLIWRRPETGDRFEMGNGSRGTVACLSPPFRSSQTAYCYTGRRVCAGATQGELPEGQEKVPWGIPVLRNGHTRYYRRHLRILYTINVICMCYRRVRRLGAPFLTKITRKMKNGEWNHFILHFQFSITYRFTDRQPESRTHPFHPDASGNALSLPRSRQRAAAQRSGSGWP